MGLSSTSRSLGALTGRLCSPLVRRVALSCIGAVALAIPAPAQSGGAEPALPVAAPAARQADNIAVITIRGEIDRWTAVSVERRMTEAIDGGADAIVFDLDTPGGEVGAVLEICNMIKNSPIPNTVAWVHPDAYSGGAIIALACREIVVAPYATMGDAAPVAGDPLGFIQGLQPTERAKILAPLLSEVVDSARRRGYDEKLVQAFLVLGVELWLIENNETGRRHFIDEAEYRVLFDGEPVRSSARFSAPGGASPARGGADSGTTQSGAPRTPAGRSSTDFKPATGELDDQTVKDVSAALETSTSRPAFSPGDKGQYTLIEYSMDGTTLLTLKTEDLIGYGFAQQTIASDDELIAYFGATNLARLDRTWSESLARFLSSFPVKGVLIVVFLLGLFIEMSAPGMGFAGGVALFALLGLMAPQFVVGASSWWWLAAVLAGLGLLAVEAFVIPGFGVFGAGGLALLFGGLLGVVVGPGGIFPDTPSEREDLLYGVTTVMLSLATAIVGAYFVSKHYGRLPVLSKLVLSDDTPDDMDEGDGMYRAMAHETGVQVGDLAIAITDLHPSGTAEIDDRIVDVVCEIGYVDQGTRLKVVETKGMTVIVAPVEDSDDTGLFADMPEELEVDRDLPDREEHA